MRKIKERNSNFEKTQVKRLFIGAIISAVICAVSGLAVLVWFFAPRNNGILVLTVPSLVGCDEDEIGTFDGIEIRREWVYSDDVERGRVISQNPYAYAKRKMRAGDSCRVTVYISLGEKTEQIPDLCGVEYISAAAALRSIGARVKSITIYGDGEDGTVFETSPKAGESIRAGETVTIFVNRQRVEEPVLVPSFIGMKISDAVRLALSIGLYVEDAESEGRVVGQSIPNGATVAHGSYIEFKAEPPRKRVWPPAIE